MAKKRLTPSTGLMDSLPVEVIGIILSFMASAHCVAMASATCRKWHEAAKHHLRKLTFDDSDFSSENGACESIITEVLMRTEFLHELSICVEGSIDSDEPEEEVEFKAASVTAWLQHTKKTLRSLTFMTPIKPKMNILDELCGGESYLEYLEWGCAYIPSVDPTIHSFESLISLTLCGMDDFLAASNLEALLTVCPKLESLSLIDIHIWEYLTINDPPPFVIVFKSCSLKSLYIDGGFSLIQNIVLHTDCLKSLWLKNVIFDQVKLVEGSEQGSLRCLKIEMANIKELDLGKPADLLHKFHLHGCHLEVDWAKYHLMISSSSNLQKLYVCGKVGHGNQFDIGLDKIALSFPRLQLLALNYQHASKAFKRGGSAKGLIFESITILELSTYKFNKQFAGWITGFLKLCPNLKRLTIAGKISQAKPGPFTLKMAEFSSLMIQIMRPYPNINMKYYFL